MQSGMQSLCASKAAAEWLTLAPRGPSEQRYDVLSSDGRFGDEGERRVVSGTRV